MWIFLSIYWLALIFILSSPDKLHEYGPAAPLAIFLGLVVEYGLGGARTLWDEATLLLPAWGVEMTYLVIYYGTQGVLALQFLPKKIHFQAPFIAMLALGNAVLESVLSPLLFGTGSIGAFLTALAIHSLRLLALIALFGTLGYAERATWIRKGRQALQQVHRSVRIWQFLWPTMAAFAFSMLRITNFFARDR